MKDLVFKIDSSNSIFKLLNTRIDHRLDIINLLVETMRFMEFAKIIPRPVVNSISLRTDKRSRLYYFLEKKYFSFAFPFFYENKKPLNFYYHEAKIDSQLLSGLKEWYNSSKNDSITTNLDISCIEAITPDRKGEFLTLLNRLINFEIGYVRYDDDITGFVSANNPEFHPQFHLDFFYSNETTIKIGGKFNEKSFRNFLDCKEFYKVVT